MEKDYEDIRETDRLSDNELRALVRDELEMQLAFDPDDVEVSVSSDAVRASGRVGTEDPEAEHVHEDIRAELFGTTDVQQAISGAIPWNPPDGPTPEGVSGPDETRNVTNDDH